MPEPMLEIRLQVHPALVREIDKDALATMLGREAVDAAHAALTREDAR